MADGIALRTPATKVLVLCATGKLGGGVARGLKACGFDVYGTTRGGEAALTALGITPIKANYVVRADVDRAIRESGATAIVLMTDFFLAAKSKKAVEAAQGKMMVDAAKAAGIAHTIFLSVGDADVVRGALQTCDALSLPTHSCLA